MNNKKHRNACIVAELQLFITEYGKQECCVVLLIKPGNDYRQSNYMQEYTSIISTNRTRRLLQIKVVLTQMDGTDFAVLHNRGNEIYPCALYYGFRSEKPLNLKSGKNPNYLYPK